MEVKREKTEESENLNGWIPFEISPRETTEDVFKGFPIYTFQILSPNCLTINPLNFTRA